MEKGRGGEESEILSLVFVEHSPVLFLAISCPDSACILTMSWSWQVNGCEQDKEGT